MDEVYADFLRLVIEQSTAGPMAADAARALATGRDDVAARRVATMARSLPMAQLSAAERWIVGAAAALASGQPRSGPGRPKVGERIAVRLEPDVRARLEAKAEAEGVTMAEAARRLLRAGLDAEA